MRCQVKNPVLAGFYPDPSIVYVDGTYYMANSTFEYYPGVQISASEDLSVWRNAGCPLNEMRLLDLRGEQAGHGIWAPDLTYTQGKFWLVFTNVRQFIDMRLKDMGNYVTTCDTIDGHWSDPVFLNGDGFDPSMFHDRDGRHYLLNMYIDYRGESRKPYTGIRMQEYDAGHQCLVGPSACIFEGTEIGGVEGPHLYYHDGYYYLFTAEGGTGFNHGETVARSRNLWGPYEVHPLTQMITSRDTDCSLQKAGHASICEGREGQWILAHLCGRPLPANQRCTLGRETALQNMVWRDGWPYLANGTCHPSDTFEGFAPAAPVDPLEEKLYRFDAAGGIDWDFLTLRRPMTPETFNLTAHPGYLRITGKETLQGLCDQAMLFRRQSHFCFEAETEVQFQPTYPNAWAGLSYRYSEKTQHYVYVSYDEAAGGRVLMKYTSRDGQSRVDRIADLPDEGPVQIRLRVTYAEGSLSGQYSYAADGVHFAPAGAAFDASELSDEWNHPLSFTGAMVGFGCQDASFHAATADFSYFRYTPLA